MEKVKTISRHWESSVQEGWAQDMTCQAAGHPCSLNRRPSGSTLFTFLPQPLRTMQGCLWRCIGVLASLVMLGFFSRENKAARVVSNTSLVSTKSRSFSLHRRVKASRLIMGMLKGSI